MPATVETLRNVLQEAGVAADVAASIDPARPLLRQGVDSMDFPAFVLALQERFGLVIDEKDSLTLRTLDDFARYIATRQG